MRPSYVGLHLRSAWQYLYIDGLDKEVFREKDAVVKCCADHVYCYCQFDLCYSLHYVQGVWIVHAEIQSA